MKTTVGKMGLPPTEDGAILPSDLPNPSNQTTSVAESAEKTPPRTVPPTCPGPAESRLVPSAIGGVPAWFVDHAEHISRCHPPSLVPPTCPGATHLHRCHPPAPVPPTVEYQHGAWHPIRPTSRLCRFWSWVFRTTSGAADPASCDHALR